MSANRQTEKERNKNIHRALKKIRGERVDKQRKIGILELEIKKLIEMENALFEQMEINRLKPNMAKEKDKWFDTKIKELKK